MIPQDENSSVPYVFLVVYIWRLTRGDIRLISSISFEAYAKHIMTDIPCLDSRTMFYSKLAQGKHMLDITYIDMPSG